jgi:hypothetical protein
MQLFVCTKYKHPKIIILVLFSKVFCHFYVMRFLAQLNIFCQTCKQIVAI